MHREFMGWVEEKNGFGRAMGWHQRFASLASNADMTVGIIGLGYVGLPTAIGFHDAGFTVWGVDVSQRTVDAVKAGKNPTGDPDVDDIVPQPGTDRWHITTSTAEAVPNCDIVLVGAAVLLGAPRGVGPHQLVRHDEVL